jgi:hypothetical protein
MLLSKATNSTYPSINSREDFHLIVLKIPGRWGAVSQTPSLEGSVFDSETRGGGSGGYLVIRVVLRHTGLDVAQQGVDEAIAFSHRLSLLLLGTAQVPRHTHTHTQTHTHSCACTHTQPHTQKKIKHTHINTHRGHTG